MRIRLLDIEIDTERSVLRQRGRDVSLERKVLALIVLLAERSNEIVSTAEILAAVWPDVATTPSSVARAVSLARRALGDVGVEGSAARIIETVRGRGYRIVPPVETFERPHVEPDQTLRDQVEAHRSRNFVGRSAELQQLAAMFEPGGPRLAYVSGPGGIGKSELLSAFARRCRKRGLRTHWVDASQWTSGESLANEFAMGDVILFDGFEQLGSLRAYVWREILPCVADPVRVVVAGRDAPAAVIDASWRALVELVDLGRFDRDEASLLLDRLDVPPSEHARLYHATQGHALSLALFGQFVMSAPRPELATLDQPDIVQALLLRLLRDVPDECQRRALWCAASVRALSQELLGSMLQEPAGDAFEWLCSQSFMRPVPQGLVPHETVRAALLADAAWRDPTGHRELLERAVDHYAEAARHRPERAAEIISLFAFIYRSRLGLEHPSPEFHVATASGSDVRAIEAMTRSHEGETSLSVLRWWCDQGADLESVRDGSGEAVGFLLGLSSSQIMARDASRDPALAPLRIWLEGESVSGDVPAVYYVRMWMARDGYQDGPVAAALMDAIASKALLHDLSYGFFCHEDPAAMIEFSRGAVSDWGIRFAAGTRELAIMGVDYSEVPPIEWNRRSIQALLEAG